MFKTKQDIENEKIAIEKIDKDLHKKLNHVFKLAVQLEKNEVGIHVEIWHSGVTFIGLGIDISSDYHRIRLKPYEWEDIGYGGGESLIQYYNLQIIIADKWLQLMKTELKRIK